MLLVDGIMYPYDGDLIKLSGPCSVRRTVAAVAGTSLSNDRCTCRYLRDSHEGSGE